jgi:YesN/AraC family two-component response regulator
LAGAHPAVTGRVYQLNVERLKKLWEALRLSPSAKESCSKYEPNGYIGNALRYIEQNYNEQLTLKAIAHAQNISRYHFARRFKAVTGYSFKEFLNRKRVEEAKELIRKDGVSVTQACYQVGFNDPTYFGRVFKRLVGRTPSDYRREFWL